MKLMVLGLLMEKPRHPYDIRQTMKQRNWNNAFRLQDGSLYYAVDQLRESGMIETIDAVPSEGEPRHDKTVYQITAEGKDELLALLYPQLEKTAYPKHPMMMAMPFLRHADPDKVIGIVELQLEECRKRVERLEQVLAVKGTAIPRSSARMIQGMIDFGRTEEKWLLDTLADAREGRFWEPSFEGGERGWKGASE